MRVFLDTTYLLPVVGIEIDLPDDLLERLFSSDHSFVSETQKSGSVPIRDS